MQLRSAQSLPARVAALLIVGSAVLTATVFAAVDQAVSASPAPAARVVVHAVRTKVIRVRQRHPKPRVAPAPAAAPPPAPAKPARPSVSLSRLVGAKVIARMTGTSPSAGLLRQVRLGHVGGVILFPDNIASRTQLRSLTAQLQNAAHEGGGAGVVIAVDQEGGPVKRLSGPPYRSPNQLAARGSSSAAEAEGVSTGRYLTSLGVNVDLAPVLDVPQRGSFIASRAFGSTPAGVARIGGSFASGLQGGGVHATLKHFPGLGRAVANTDLGPSTVSAPRSVLRRDLRPFATAITGGASVVMMSSATYPAFGLGPAVLNPALVTGELRGRLGFRGVVVSDDLEGGAIRAVTSPSRAAVSASRAGVDMVLYAQQPAAAQSAFEALYSAARAGQLDRSRLRESYRRIQRLQRESE